MKDRLNDYYGSRYELRNQPEAVEGRVNNMLGQIAAYVWRLMLKKGLENNYEDSDRCKHSKPAIDIFKAGRGRNTPKSNTDVAWSRK